MVEAEPRRIRLDDLAHLGAQSLGEHHLRTPGRLSCEVAGVRRDRCPVVARGVGDIHSGELADRRLVLEDRLKHPLAHLGLVGRIRGQELSAGKYGVDDRGNVVVVDPRPEERDLPTGVDIARGQLGQRAEAIKSFETALKQDPRNVQSMIGLAGALSADGRRDKASELLQRIDVMLNGAAPPSESLKNELQSVRQHLSRTTG